MRIQVVGVGVVGSAQAYLLSRLGHEVLGLDHHRTSFDYARMLKEPEKNAELTFICTPEGAVPEAVADLMSQGVGGLLVIKSTVPPGTTRALSSKYNRHICHNPEFLREKTPFEDVTHPNCVVIGQCCPEHADILRNLYSSLNCPIAVTQPDVSETVKLTLNSYLATLITFWNEIDKFANSFGISTREVADIVKLNPRVSAYGTEFFGSPFGGKCLPKDLEQLIKASLAAGMKPQLLEAIREYNRTLDVHAV